MLNQVVAVGRLTSDIEIRENEDGVKKAYVTLAIPRTFKNKEGEYDTDFIGFELYGPIAENTAEYCKKGDIVGIKGRLATVYEKENEGNRIGKIVPIAEKVTFLSSRSKDSQERE